MDGFVNGAIGGMIGLTMSHPIDTVKTHVQTNKPVPRNLLLLYRGFLPPLFGMAVEKAIVFGTYQWARDHNLNNPSSGALAGLMASMIVTPYERLKIIRQSGHVLQMSHFHPTSLWRGLSATFTREVPGFAIYFSVYENSKRLIYKDQEITKTGSLLLGGLSGATAWFFIFPQDVVKTRLQSLTETKRINTLETVRQLYQEQGFRGFFRGFHFALLRAVPLHAGTFLGVEMMRKMQT